jgi:carbohydrate-binding DOMON domain-containing protein
VQAVAPPVRAGDAIVVLEDPRGDDDGPGGYVYPSGREYVRGAFDLRRFELSVDGDDAVVQVTFDVATPRPMEPRVSGARPVELDNGLHVQNVDVYIDTDPLAEAGVTQAVPGRRVTLDADGAWEVAVVLTPQPFAVRSALDGAMGGAERRVIVPAGVTASGATVTARVPLVDLGGTPQASWGYAVFVTGAVWEQSVALQDRVFGSYQPNAYTMPVMAVAQTQAFGGGVLSRHHPAVVDLIAPAGRDQHAILSGYDPVAERYAAVPMVYPNPAARARAKAAVRAVRVVDARDDNAAEAPVVFRIADVQGDRLVLDAPEGALREGRLGVVMDAQGRTLGRVVVSAVFAKFAVAVVLDGQDQVKIGGRVRFDRAAGSRVEN